MGSAAPFNARAKTHPHHFFNTNPTHGSCDTMPHICGPHSQLPNCRYHDQMRQKQEEEPTTTWVPIPIHKVQEVTEESANNFNFNRSASQPYHVQQPQRSSPSGTGGGVSRAVPIQLLASPNLILSAAGKQQQLPAKDELFPRKKKSEFTM